MSSKSGRINNTPKLLGSGTAQELKYTFDIQVIAPHFQNKPCPI